MSDASKPSPSGRPPPVSLQVTGESQAPPAQAPPANEGATADSTAPPPSSKVDPYLGKTIDRRYVIEQVLGEGGMGVVYAARHKVIAKRVAIKVLRGEMVTDHEANERFLQEARAASAIGNPHIVDISDFGQLPDGSTYFVMELLAGKSLGALLAEEQAPVPVRRLCHIAKQIAQGLAAAHAANIVHRDLKPDNVMLINHGVEKDFVKILDFGIAKVGSGTKKMTRAGSVFGTPHYMSPEQAAGTVVDHRTDVYALGVMLYEMASGKVPFDADNFMGILTQHMYKAPVPIRALVPAVDVPPGLEAIVLKCLSKKREERYAGMDQLVRDLEKLEQGMVPDAVEEMMARSGAYHIPSDYFRSSMMPAPVPAEPTVPRKRWPLYAVLGGVVTVVGIVVVVLALRSGSGTAQARLPAAGPAAASVADPIASAASMVLVPLAAATASTAVIVHDVVVNVVPSDATLSRDGSDLGGAPVVLHLADGEVATLVIVRKGYKTKTVSVPANAPKQTVTLEATGVSYRPTRPAAPAVAAPKSGGLDDVGDPFSKH